MKLRVTVIVSVILIGLTACSSPGLLAETDQAGASLPSPTLDPATGLHVTGTAKEIDPTSYRLEVTGMVGNPLSLSYDDLRCLPKNSFTVNWFSLGSSETRQPGLESPWSTCWIWQRCRTVRWPSV